MVSLDINKYIENSKINNRLCRWNKAIVTIFVTEITLQTVDKTFLYLQMQKAIALWNDVLCKNFINIQFRQVSNVINADIIVHWKKVGRIYEGMCKYPSIINGCFKKIYIDIGLPNELSGKEVTDKSIFATMLHELGHSLGLGHGVDVDDVMFVPHQKNVITPSENDVYVLKEIYK